jgi:uncharacterized membrane protein YqiK
MGSWHLSDVVSSWWMVAGIAFMVVLVIGWAGTRVIDEQHSGLVIKRYGPPLPEGRIIATNGEAGYQARMLPPGWHVGWWRWRYKIFKVPVTLVGPGEIALVVAADGKPMPSERVLGEEVA